MNRGGIGAPRRRVAAISLGVALSVVVALAVQKAVLASDHLDGPRATANPQADIADVFAFTSPANPSNVVLAMTVTPFASSSASFAADVDYVFRVRRIVALSPFTLDDPVLDVTCSFDSASPQHVTCSAPGGLTATAAVVDETGGGGSASTAMRVFAGLRSDPAYFDRQGALATMATRQASFTGANAFEGANVLAIVVELDSVAAFGVTDGGSAMASEGGSERPIIAVAAETVRRGP
jgi:hypothetical protein